MISRAVEDEDEDGMCPFIELFADFSQVKRKHICVGMGYDISGGFILERAYGPEGTGPLIGLVPRSSGTGDLFGPDPVSAGPAAEDFASVDKTGRPSKPTVAGQGPFSRAN
jgi:hypothetical protein